MVVRMMVCVGMVVKVAMIMVNIVIWVMVRWNDWFLAALGVLQTNGRTNGQTFVIVESLSRLKTLVMFTIDLKE